MDSRYLFRGKRETDGKWLIGHLVSGMGESFIVSDVLDFDDEFIAFESWWVVLPETIGQSTGLYAAKSYRGESEEDRLIWENDIIHDVQFGKGIVKYMDGAFVSLWCVPPADGWRSTLLLVMLNDDDVCEVDIIGTVHDEQGVLK